MHPQIFCTFSFNFPKGGVRGTTFPGTVDENQDEIHREGTTNIRCKFLWFFKL